MNITCFRRRSVNKMLFVWDGSTDHLDQVAEYARQNKCRVVAVIPLPHEWIYSYGTIRNDDEPAYAERMLRRAFAEATKQIKELADVELVFLFGDRITEIVRFAKTSRVSVLLMPRFEQSSFSRWIHGDLNERLDNHAPCPIVFLGTAASHSIGATNSTPSGNPSNCL